jgi:outer membrane protein TolC
MEESCRSAAQYHSHALSCWCTGVFRSQGLLARRNDPIYLAARAKFDAALARRSQARSYLLPQLMLKGTATETDRRYETLDTILRDPITNAIYDGYTATVTLTQALYRRANFLG